jgi:signal transduction histidine kinase
MGRDKDQSLSAAAAEQCRFEEVRSRVKQAVLSSCPTNETDPAHDKSDPALYRGDETLDVKSLDLAEHNRQLMEISRSNADFLANMSHELRSPLNSVIGFSEVLLDQLYGSLNEKQKEYIKNILGSGVHLLTLIDDIIDLSTMEAGTLALELRNFSFREALTATMLMHREKALKCGVDLHMNFAPEVDVLISADQRKLKRIMFTLLANAIRATPAGGTVHVSTRRDGDCIEITVADTGRGIKVEEIPRLFQASPQQLEAVDSGKCEEVGPGLVFIRQLVELHGGRIWVKSYFGMGSRFTFTLPLYPTATVVASAHRADTVDAAGKTILLIEDEQLTLAATEHALHDKGYRVLRAKDGEDGIEIARSTPPDLIVLDLMLPGINGFDVVERLRHERAAENIPILILTSMKMQSADRERLAGKVWRIAEKGSLSTHDFINLVESAVGSK